MGDPGGRRDFISGSALLFCSRVSLSLECVFQQCRLYPGIRSRSLGGEATRPGAKDPERLAAEATQDNRGWQPEM